MGKLYESLARHATTIISKDTYGTHPGYWIVPITSGGRRVRDISASESFSIYSLSAPAPEAERPPVIIKITKF